MRRNYNDEVYYRWRVAVFKRDKFCCQMPGCKSKKYLNAHHIQKWASASSMRYDTSNGITLCRYHHNEVTGKETHYEKLFRDIIRRKHG